MKQCIFCTIASFILSFAIVIAAAALVQSGY
jgi:hypothetical protein